MKIINKAEQLSKIIYITDEEKNNINKVSQVYKMRISEYYANLIDKDNINCPIKKQCVPCLSELEDNQNLESDPLNEKIFSPIPYLVHKYNDRAAFFASNSCFTYCRHCTRKNTVINDKGITEKEFQNILEYLRNTNKIRDVLITGGDPLTLTDKKLEFYISNIRKIKHIETIRIGTRAIVTNPLRITEDFADMLSKYHPIWINTQFNHPNEITKESAFACNILQSRGIPLGNQSVLLKGINDDIDIMERLVTKLIKIRVRPYYLYQCDNVKGTEHFHTDYKLGIDIVEKLRYRVSGYAVPRFIIDVSGENGGKVTVEKNHIVKEYQDKIILSGRTESSFVEYKTGENNENRFNL